MLKAFIDSDHQISGCIARSISAIDLAKRNLIQDPRDRQGERFWDSTFKKIT